MSKVTLPSVLVACALAFAGVGCGKTGMGAAVRTDITTRMQTAEPAIQSCYAKALQRNRKLRGMLVLSITAEASTGQFKNITPTRDELGDAELKTCVVDAVAQQKLEKPQKTNTTFSYPLQFSPTK